MSASAKAASLWASIFFIGIGATWINGVDFPTERGDPALGFYVWTIFCATMAAVFYKLEKK